MLRILIYAIVSLFKFLIIYYAAAAPQAIVFIVGGGNYIEYQNLMDYSKVCVLLEITHGNEIFKQILNLLSLFLCCRGILVQRNCCMELVKL